ncbi:MAG: Protein of unknown function transrane [Subtercola sp.]|nr:Protein of unknown function transrane [Subtercola sp.]
MISLAIAAVVVVGIMVGVEFAVAVFVNPMLARLPLESSMAARSDGARILGRVMPVWYSLSLVLMLASAVFSWGQPAGLPALLSAILLAVSVVMSILFLVPINSRSAGWTPESAPSDWREQINRWDRLHYVRVAIIIAAFALATVALALVG